MDSYSLKTSISEYARAWTQRRWGVDSTVIYPPCDSSFRPGEKRNRIVSVGRFAGDRAGGVSKRQLEMMRAFLELYANGFSDWEYHTLGGVGAWPQDIAYAQQVREIAQTNADAHVVANAPRETLSELYASSKIFWHAAGFRDDDQQHPELMEHFGIATVDAMSAGCVPVVINKGAQPEIVEHGVSGFLWNTVDELKNYTRILAQDGELQEQMANAAMRQAERFSRENFVRRFAEFIQPVLNVPVT